MGFVKKKYAYKIFFCYLYHKKNKFEKNPVIDIINVYKKTFFSQ